MYQPKIKATLTYTLYGQLIFENFLTVQEALEFIERRKGLYEYGRFNLEIGRFL